MRFFLKLLGFSTVVMRLAVVFSPLAFMLFGGKMDFEFVNSNHQPLLFMVFTLVLAFVLFLPEIYSWTMREFMFRSQDGFQYQSDEDGLAKKQPSSNTFDWMTPGTADYFLYEDSHR
jgi:hypothetical protein